MDDGEEDDEEEDDDDEAAAREDEEDEDDDVKRSSFTACVKAELEGDDAKRSSFTGCEAAAAERKSVDGSAAIVVVGMVSTVGSGSASSSESANIPLLFFLFCPSRGTAGACSANCFVTAAASIILLPANKAPRPSSLAFFWGTFRSSSSSLLSSKILLRAIC